MKALSLLITKEILEIWKAFLWWTSRGPYAATEVPPWLCLTSHQSLEQSSLPATQLLLALFYKADGRLKPNETQTLASTCVNRPCNQISKSHGKLSLSKNYRIKSITFRAIPRLRRRPEHSFMSKFEINQIIQYKPLTRRKTIIYVLSYTTYIIIYIYIYVLKTFALFIPAVIPEIACNFQYHRKVAFVIAQNSTISS